MEYSRKVPRRRRLTVLFGAATMSGNAARRENYLKLGECAEALELTATFLAMRSTIHPVILWEGREGASLFDTGFPGQLPAIESGLAARGVKLKDVRRIFLSHQDLDHVGGAEALQAATGAEVYAHAADKPYIEGEKRLAKIDPARFEDRLKGMPERLRHQARLMMSSPPTVKVDHILQGGEVLPFHGGIEVIATPGHTPGHVCFYVTTLGLLIAGDALRVENGELRGPSPTGTPDMPAAIASLKNLLRYRIAAVLCYHGGYFDRDPGPRIQQITESAPTAA
jgi:glyoxylase-like metal-dependent hydrolase (beta-lactamase superfamily II)